MSTEPAESAQSDSDTVDPAAARFRRAIGAFSAAVQMDPAARRRFLDAQCGEDTGLRREVEAMLAHDGTGDRAGLTGAGHAVVVARRDEANSDGDGTDPTSSAALAATPRIDGHYRIIRQLGEGGMGVVYLAEQTIPRRMVAIKAVRPGLTSHQVLSRFAHEMHILGRLQHPSIAQIYEAGVVEADHTGQAFIVMEYVDGPTLTRFADVHALSVRDRLALFARVCDAVHHAHLRRVIHRDLKPANILVDAAGTPKVLDFGVATLLADEEVGVVPGSTLETHEVHMVGTPAYMAPEQFALGDRAADARSDVFSLGVMLFELLAGRLPIPVKGLSILEAGRAVQNVEPPRLAQLANAAGRDADAIAAKALQKDPERRFQSAGELASDIRRSLRGDAILARQDSGLYVAGRSIRRHRAAALITAMLLVGLVGFASFAMLKAHRERQLATAAQAAGALAQAEFARAESTNASLTRELFLAGLERARLEAALGNTPLAEHLLWKAWRDQPDTPATTWGLRELYYRAPTQWAINGLFRPTAVALDADGRMVAMGDKNGTIAFYDASKRTELAKRDRLPSGVTALALAGDTACAGLANGTVLLLRVDDPRTSIGLTTKTNLHSGGVLAAALSDNGKLLVTGGQDGMIRLWDVGSHQLVRAWPAHAGPVITLAFNPDGTQVASGARTTGAQALASLWRVADGTLVADCGVGTDSRALRVVFTPRGDQLAVCSYDRAARFFSLAGGTDRELRHRNMWEGVFDVDWSPSGTQMLVLSGQSPLVFDDGGATPIAVLPQNRGYVIAGRWIDEESVLIVTVEGAIKVVASKPEAGLTRLSGFPSWCFGVDFSPDGSRLAIGAHGCVRIIGPAGSFPPITLPVEPPNLRTRCVKFLPDGKTLITGASDGMLRLYHADQRLLLSTWPLSSSEIYSLALSPDNRVAAVGHADGTIRLWSIAAGELLAELPVLERRVEGLSFSADGQYLASAGLRSGVQVWHVDSRAAADRLPTTATVWAVAYSPDGRLLAATTHDGSLLLFDAQSRAQLATIRGHGRLIPALAFSSDSSSVLTGSEDGQIKLWDVASRRSVFSVALGGGVVVNVAMDPTGRYLAASTSNLMTALIDTRVLDAYVASNQPYQLEELDTPGR